MRYITTIDEREFLVEIVDRHHVLIDGESLHVDLERLGDQPLYSLLLDGKSYEAYVDLAGESWRVLLKGRSYLVQVEEEQEKNLRVASGSQAAESSEFHLRSPMPGLVVSIPVREGQQVRKGDVLLILESMKMQNELKSPRDGMVSRLRVKQGDSVEQHQTMLSVV